MDPHACVESTGPPYAAIQHPYQMHYFSGCECVCVCSCVGACPVCCCHYILSGVKDKV